MIRRTNLGVVVALCYLTGWNCSCQTPAHEDSSRIKQVAPSGENAKSEISSIPVVVPHNILAGGTHEMQVASRRELDEVMRMQLPAVSRQNADLTPDEVVEGLTSRKILWIPRARQSAGEQDSSRYADVYKSMSKKTVGQYLRAQISGSTEMGYPWLRTFNRDLDHINDPPRTDEENQLKLMDVVFLTKKFIVICAVPQE